MAEAMPGASARRPRGLAGPAGLGDGLRSPRRGRRGPASPAGRRTRARAVLSLRAWLAARLGDPHAEQAAWTQLLERCPATPGPWPADRAGARAGRTDRSPQLRRRKAELDRASDAYRMALTDQRPDRAVRRAGPARRDTGPSVRGPRLVDPGPARTGPCRRGPRRPGPARPHRAGPGVVPARADATPSSRTLADALADLIPRDDRRREPGRSSPASAVPVFRDDAPAAGLRFIYENDPTPLCRLPETMGGGVGLLDYDGDGWLDVYAVQGGKLPDDPSRRPSPQGDRLFRNRGDGTFEDVTAAAGLAAMPGGYGHGVAVGDYRQRRPPRPVRHPLAVLCAVPQPGRRHVRGRHRGRAWAATATGRRRRPSPTSTATATSTSTSATMPTGTRERSAPCPHPNDPDRSRLLRPARLRGHARPRLPQRRRPVRRRLRPAGVRVVDRDGRGLGVVAADLDDDGRIDLFVANDMTANFLFRNLGGFRFEETAGRVGRRHQRRRGLPGGHGDRLRRPRRRRPARPGRHQLLRRVDHVLPEPRGRAVRRPHRGDRPGGASRYLLGFGIAFLDADNDGRLDLATANGHVNDLRPDVPYAMPAQLLLGTATGRLVDVSRRAGAPLAGPAPRPRPGRRRPRQRRPARPADRRRERAAGLLPQPRAGRPLRHLPARRAAPAPTATPSAPRDAHRGRPPPGRPADRRRQLPVGQRPRLHFGLGEATRIETIEVRWPSGHVDRYTDLAADPPTSSARANPRPARFAAGDANSPLPEHQDVRLVSKGALRAPGSGRVAGIGARGASHKDLGKISQEKRNAPRTARWEERVIGRALTKSSSREAKEAGKKGAAPARGPR